MSVFEQNHLFPELKEAFSQVYRYRPSAELAAAYLARLLHYPQEPAIPLHRLQQFICRAKWDADRLAQQLYPFVQRHCMGAVETGMLIPVEMTFLKQGNHSCGVHRSFCEQEKKVRNCQVGLIGMFYQNGVSFPVGRRLLIPKNWFADPDRCQRAGIPPSLSYATREELMGQMVAELVRSPLSFHWVVSNSFWEEITPVRQVCEETGTAYLFRIHAKAPLPGGRDGEPAELVAKKIPATEWQAVAPAPPHFVWAMRPLWPGAHRVLLIRRIVQRLMPDLYYIGYTPEEPTLDAFVRRILVADQVEQSVPEQETLLRQYEVRGYRSWYRHMTLACWARALQEILEWDTEATNHANER